MLRCHHRGATHGAEACSPVPGDLDREPQHARAARSCNHGHTTDSHPHLQSTVAGGGASSRHNLMIEVWRRLCDCPASPPLPSRAHACSSLGSCQSVRLRCVNCLVPHGCLIADWANSTHRINARRPCEHRRNCTPPASLPRVVRCTCMCVPREVANPGP